MQSITVHIFMPHLLNCFYTISQIHANDARHEANAELFAAEAEKIVLNTTDFSMLSHSSTYIDKTQFLLDFLQLPPHVVITGPRGFSKSTNLMMLKLFLEHELADNHAAKNPENLKKLDLFKDKKVFSNGTLFWKHFARYPVVYVDLSSVRTNTFSVFINSFVENCIRPLLNQFRYLLDNPKIWELPRMNPERFSKNHTWKKDELKKFGADLASLLRKHHDTKVIILIDEYDSPVVSAILDADVSTIDTENIIEFMGAFVNAMTKHSADIHRTILMGNLAITLEYDLGMGSSNLEYYSIFDSTVFYTAYGLTEANLDELQKRLHVPPSQMEITKLYYKGYYVYDNPFASDPMLYISCKSVAPKTRIFNTYSVLASLKNVEMKQWWPSGEVPLKLLIAGDKYGAKFEECMLRSCQIESESFISKFDLMQLKKSLLKPENPLVMIDTVLSFLFQSGYFTAMERSGDTHTITAPNFEVQTKMMDGFYRRAYFERRYGFSKADEEQFILTLDKLSSDVATLKDVVKSIQNLFKKEAPMGEKFMQVVLFYPLVNSTKFEAYRIERYTDTFLRYDFIARRKRDNAGILFTMHCRPQDLKRAFGRITKAPVAEKFKLIPDLEDKIDLRLVMSAKKEKCASEDFTSNTTDLYKVLTLPSYIDKTWFIHDLLDLSHHHVAISGPRGFSKSTNLNTLKAFLELDVDENHNAMNPMRTRKLPIFQEMKIFSNKKFFYRHFALRPVVHLDLSLVKKNSNFEEFVKSFGENCIAPLINKFAYVSNSSNIPDSKLEKVRKQFLKVYRWTNTDLYSFPAGLADLLSRHHSAKAIVLIDDYDHPITSAFLDPLVTESDSGKIFDFVEKLISMVTKQKDTYLVFLTGTLGIEFPDAHKLHHETIFDSLYSAYGFLEDDLHELGRRFSIPPDELKVLKTYHGGYWNHDDSDEILFKNPKMNMYNTFSIITYLQTKQSVMSFGGVETLIPLLTHKKCGPKFEQCVLNAWSIVLRSKQWGKAELLQLKRSLNYEAKADCDLVLRVFLDNGFFRAKISHDLYTLTAPNFEVKAKLMDYLYKSTYLKDRYGYSEKDEEDYVSAVENLSTNIDTLKDVVLSIQNLFMKTVPESEAFVQPVLFYPLDTKGFTTYQIQRYTSSSSSYDIFAKRERDCTGILFQIQCQPGDVGRAIEQMKNAPPSRTFELIPGLNETIELRLIVNVGPKVYGFYNYTNLGGNSTIDIWPTK